MNKDELIGLFGFMGVISAVGGAFIACCGFTILSALAIGGIVCALNGLIAAAFFSCFINIARVSMLPEFWEDEISFTFPMFATSCVISAAIGVGLAAAVTNTLPVVFATLGGTVAFAAAIGFIAPIVGVLALYLLPTIEKAIEFCFPQTQDRNDLSQGPTISENNKSPSTSVNDTNEKNPSDGISFSRRAST